MTKELRILAPESFREKLSRRSFLQMGTVTAGLALVVVACGGTSSDSTDTTAAAPADDGLAKGDWSRVINQSSGTLVMYTWGDYNDPLIVGALAEEKLAFKMKVDYYGSNEDLITKLAASNGASGFDIVVPTGPYVPQMIQKGLIQKFDKTLLPNMVNVDPNYLGQAWDTTNDYSVCKNWGSFGFFYDTTKISKELNTWQDFLDACMGEASGKCSVIDAAPNYAGPWFWANGHDWNTEDVAILDQAEKFLVKDLAKHIKAFDSYPSGKLAEGAYILSAAWNGDARQAYVRIEEAGETPANWRWVLGAPATELWMDNYCIATGAPNPEAAHAWINWSLTPEISVQDLSYHGYNTGMKNMESLIADIAPDLVKGEMIFFPEDQVKTMHTQILNTSIDRLVEILNKAKAEAGD